MIKVITPISNNPDSEKTIIFLLMFMRLSSLLNHF
jgi:hypothetical protein